MNKHFRRLFLEAYRGLYIWHLHDDFPAVSVRRCQAWMRRADGLSAPPGLEAVLMICAIHLSLSCRNLTFHRDIYEACDRAQLDAARDMMLTESRAMLEEMIATRHALLSTRTRACLQETLFWISLQQRDDQQRLEDDRQSLFDTLSALPRDSRLMAIASMTVDQGDACPVHVTLRHHVRAAWRRGEPDGLIYALRNQINRGFIIEARFWWFDRTLASVLDDLGDDDLKALRRRGLHQRGRRLNRLFRRKQAQWGDELLDHKLAYSVLHRGCQYRFKFPQKCRVKFPQFTDFGDQPIA